MRGILLFLLLLMAGPALRATGDSLNYLTPKDTIFITLDPQGDKIFRHTMAPKQTLYSLAEFYGLSLNDLYLYNPGLRNTGISVGQAIRIPIPNRAILRYRPEDYHPEAYVPVCYVVRKGDTMYRIGKQHFRMPMDTIRVRNGLPDYQVKTGQALQVGWMSMEGIPDSLRAIQGGPLWEKSFTLSQLYQAQGEGKQEREERGVATWQKGRVFQGQELMILHRTAPVNSVIALTNPMSRKTVYVRVIGKVPPIYDENIIAVVTPTVAEMLDVIDPRFFVHTRFFK
jgi:LysM repeat protein